MLDNYLIKRRIIILMNVIILIFFVFILRFSFLYAFKYDYISKKALDLWTRSIPIEGQRGIIYDRNGRVIVGNELAPSLAVIPGQIEQPEEISKTISSILDVSRDEIYEHLVKKVSIELIKPEGRKLTVEQVIEIEKHGFKGVYIINDTRRSYKYGDMLAQVLGFTGIDNQGIAGIEYIYDNYLMGNNGYLNIHTDAKGNNMYGLDDILIDSSRGFDISLTIDLSIQLIMEKIFQKNIEKYEPDQMLGLAMNVKTGEILGMVSYPTFDPYNYQDYEQEIYNRNLPIWMSFEPGSTFKIVTYAAGLEEGVFNLDDLFFDPGYYMVDGARIKDWKAGGHGQQTFLEVIQNSCNPGFIEIGLKLGKEVLFDYIESFGFGKKTGVDLLGESTGIVFNPDVIGNVELATSAFGQGNSTTPIQIVTAASAAVNGGNLMTPYILQDVRLSNGDIIYTKEPVLRDTVISKETSDLVKYALEMVVAKGTGRGAFIEGYRIGGKTGTAQKVGEDGQYMDNNYILSFLGMAPMNDPDIAIYVAIDNPKDTIQYGGVVAAPIVKEIFNEVLPILNLNKDIENQIDKEYRYWIDTFYYNVDDYIGKNIKSIIESPFFHIEIIGSGNEVIMQIPSPGEKIPEGGTVILYTN